MTDTHFLTTEGTGRKRLAECGALVFLHQHSATPSCEGCREVLAERKADEHLTADDVFGPPPDAYPPVAPPFDVLAGYRPRTR